MTAVQRNETALLCLIKAAKSKLGIFTLREDPVLKVKARKLCIKI